ncbi:hypothetical protein TNCV_4435021 [Trichonephila clavipes]|nr:hypothetical protein TNCV_4435021 [Trichonephila clavipes]
MGGRRSPRYSSNFYICPVYRKRISKEFGGASGQRTLWPAKLYPCTACWPIGMDIMPSGLAVHWVLIAPRDNILQNVETVTQCFTWSLHHWRSPRGIQTHRFFISREIYCIEQLGLYNAEDCDVMLQWTVVLAQEFDDGRRDC